MQICEYGCGQKAKYQFQNHKWCCSKTQNKCQGIRKRIGSKLKGIKKSESHKKHISESKIGLPGHPAWNKGLKGNIPWNKGLKGAQAAWNKNTPPSQKTRDKISKSLIGNIPWNKNKCDIWSEEQLKINSIKNTPTIEQVKQKYPLFAKIEEIRYESGKEKEKIIQVHCKNHLCPNSKEQGGWFNPTKSQLNERIRNLDRDGSYFYCSEECKEICPLFRSRGNDPFQIKQESLYTSSEYQTFRQQVLKRENYICEYCGKPATDVHHSRPQKLEPGLILDPDFGVACCEKCHYKYGHKDECSTGKLANVVCEGI